MADDATSGAGVKTAIDQAMAERPAAAHEPAQAEERSLFERELAEAAADAPAGVSLLGELELLEDGTAVEGGRRGRGRPRGSQNRTTTEMVRLLRAKGYQDPLEAAAQIYSRPTGALAAEMGIKASQAAQLQLRAIDAALPYWHAKKPQSLDLGGAALPLVQIINQAAGGHLLDGTTTVEIGRVAGGDWADGEGEVNQ